MKKLLIASALVLSMLSGCNLDKDSTKHEQSNKARAAAAAIVFTENAEISGIEKRLKLTSQVNLSGYIVLLNESGQPILYTGVIGKIISGSKRLTPTVAWGGNAYHPTSSDEGTYGSSNEYVYFWDTRGVYHQWNGKYLYSTQPIRLRVEPLVIAVDTK